MNLTDQAKLKVAVKKILGRMVKEHLNQLQVSHRTLHELGGLENARMRSLINHVDDVLMSDDIVRGGYGPYLVADVGVIAGEAQMAFIKQNSGLRHLVVDSSGELQIRQQPPRPLHRVVSDPERMAVHS